MFAWLRRLLGIRPLATVLIRWYRGEPPGEGEGRANVTVELLQHPWEEQPARLLALCLPLLVENQMLVLSRDKRELLGERLRGRLSDRGAKAIPGDQPPAGAVPLLTLKVELQERGFPFCTTQPRLHGAYHLEEAIVEAIDAYVGYELARLPPTEAAFARRALEEELAHWARHGYPGGIYLWEWLFTWRG